MDQQKIDQLQADLATALAAVDRVSKAVHVEVGYRFSRRQAGFAVHAISELSRYLDGDWAEDERELDQEVREVKTLIAKEHP